MSTHQQSKLRRANQSMTDESGRPSTCKSKVGCDAMDEPCTNKILPAALVGSPADFSNRKSFTSPSLAVQCSCAWTAAAWVTLFVTSFMICSLKNRGANLTCNTAKDDLRAALGCRFRKLPLAGPNGRYTRLPCAFLCPALRVAAVGLQRESA